MDKENKNYYAVDNLPLTGRLIDLVYLRNHLAEEILELENADFDAAIWAGGDWVGQLHRDELDFVIANRTKQLKEVDKLLSEYEDDLKQMGYKVTDFSEGIQF